MKTIQALIVFCTFSLSLEAQVSFILSSTPGAGGSDPNSVAAADVNGDGKVDLISANYFGNTLTILTNNGNGGFILSGSYPVGSEPISIAATDVNGDGKVDLICANGQDGTLSVLTNNGSGGFVLSGTYPVGSGPTSVTVADVNGDGKVDLISANWGSSGQGNTLTVYTNNGQGGFALASSPVVGSSPISVTAADVNGDGKVDLISANWGSAGGGNTLTILTNNGSGGFVLASSPIVGNGPYSVVASDVNGDGKVDLVCANRGSGSGNTLTVLTNSGSATFGSNATINVGNGVISVAASDVNGDGKVDLISANLNDSTLSVLTNNGSGGFVLATNLSVGNSPNSVTAADVNGDGKVDLISPSGGNNSLYVFTNATVLAPVITAQPTNLLVLAGTNAMFGVSLTNSFSSPSRYQWRFNGTNILNATTATYAITPVATNNAGIYSLIVSNLAGSATSSNAILAAVTSPASLTNNAGSTATFSTFTFSPVPLGDRWQWQKNGASLFDGGNITGSASNTLTVTNISDSDAGLYSVIVSNALGTITTSNATLAVVDQPVITAQPPNLLVLAGTNATFGVSLTGSVSYFRYQWQLYGTNILNATNATYAITSVATINAGNYSLIVTNLAGGVTSSNAILAVVTSPASLTNYAGSTATFSTFTFSPMPLGDRWQWQKNGANLFDGGNISGSAGNTLTVANISDSDAGMYSVIVSNALGTITTSNATLAVNDTLTITTQPQSQTNVIGSTVSFNATAYGVSPLLFQWYFNGTPVGSPTAGTNFATYTITNVSTNQAGIYTVQVVNGSGSVMSSNAVLTVAVSPVITAQPLSRTNNLNSTATFSVTAFSALPLGYQWQQNGTNLVNGGKFSGVTNSTLTITGVTSNEATIYAVIVTNTTGGATSSNAVLTVLYPPLVTAQPSSLLVLPGTNVAFGASLNGTTPFAYNWQFNGTNILNATNATYTISSVVTNNAGNYSLVITNAAGSVTSSVAGLTVLLSPTNKISNAGSTVTFVGTAFNPGGAAYQWQMNGTNLINGGKFSGVTNSTLTITSVSSNEAAIYTVTVTNTAGSITSSNATLTVLYPPIITTPQANLLVLAGSNISFSASFTGLTQFGYQWLFNGTNILNATNATYTISPVATNNAGNYSVAANFSTGSATSSIAGLTVLLSPTNLVKAANSTATFTAPAFSPLALAYQWQMNGTNLVNGGKFSGATNSTLTITGVSSNEAAIYAVTVTNTAGSVTSSNATLTVIYPPNITTQPLGQRVVVGNSVSFGVAVSGTAPFSYQWRYNAGNLPNATNAIYGIQAVGTNNTGNYSVIVTNVVGSVTSSNALLLVVVPPSLALQFAAGYPLLNLNGMLSNNFVVQYSTNLTSTNWINLLSLTNLLTSPYLFLDPAGVVPPARFYRAVMQ